MKPDSVVFDELLWRNVRSTRDSVHHKGKQYSREIYIKGDLLAAWDEWCLGIEEPMRASEKEFGLFMNWFFYNWVCPRLLEPRAQVAIMYLANRFSTLTSKELKYVKSLLAEPMTFYEATEATPNHGIQVRCILSGRESYVSEKLGSQGIYPGDIFFVRLGVIGETTIFDSVSDILIPLAWKAAILELRSKIKRLKRLKKNDFLKPNHVLDFEKEIREVYREIRDRPINPKPPQLVNTDGDALSFNKVIFEIRSANDAFKALHSLCYSETFDSLLNRAEIDLKNTIVHLEFPWLKKGNQAHKGMENTVLGNITIEKGKLTIDVNSLEREASIKGIIEKQCKGNARYKITLIESLEAKMNEIQLRQSQRSIEQDARQQLELMSHPEVKVQLREMHRRHMESWVTERIPALGNKTPMQAVKTAEEREMVVALLNQFEGSAGRPGDRDFELELMNEIRIRLGLTSS